MDQQNEWHTPYCDELFQHWKRLTGHYPGSGQTLACKIYHACGYPSEHVGFACSLSRSGNEISHFMRSGPSMLDEIMFAKLLILLLDEFVDGMRRICAKARLPVPKSPRNLSMWANIWAKHRVHLLLQHHPIEELVDLAHNDVIQMLNERQYIDLHSEKGDSTSCMVIDSKNLDLLQERSNASSMLKSENWTPWIVLVPSLIGFLDEAYIVYKDFVDTCVQNKDKVVAYNVPKCNLVG